MAARESAEESHKRKRPASTSKGGDGHTALKKSNHMKSKPPKPYQPGNGSKTAKPIQLKQRGKFTGAKDQGAPEKVPMTKRELRLAAKAKAEERKKKRKRHYNLEQELTSLWEKMRRRKILKKEKSMLISEASLKMRGKISEIATSHVSSRVLQTCLKYGSQTERDAVFDELRPHFLTLSCNAYAVHLVKKLLDNASKSQLDWFISALHGHVSSLLRHMVGSVVVEHAFQLGNASQKRRLLLELYSTELQLFKDLTLSSQSRLVDIMSKLGLQKSSVLIHMTSVIQPILEKGIVDHSILHTVLMEYFSIADKSSVTDVMQQLSGPLLVRMIHTKDGSKIGILCIKHGAAKERKKIVKGMKGTVERIAQDQYGSLVMVSILSAVDDTKLLSKIVINELQTKLKDLVFDKYGRRPILHLLHPQCQSYLSHDDLSSLSSSVPSLSAEDLEPESMNDAESEKLNSSANNEGDSDKSGADDDYTNDDNVVDSANCAGSKVSSHLAESGKKDPELRRYELLITSGFAESLIDVCITNLKDLLFSHFGKDIVYEVARGAAGSILFQTLSEKVNKLHEAIASLGAIPKDESEEEHVFHNFHANRTIRKLVLECPAFATTLWNSALKGRSELWAQGHSLKVIYAFLESSDSVVRKQAEIEMKTLIEAGIFKDILGQNLEK